MRGSGPPGRADILGIPSSVAQAFTSHHACEVGKVANDLHINMLQHLVANSQKESIRYRIQACHHYLIWSLESTIPSSYAHSITQLERSRY